MKTSKLFFVASLLVFSGLAASQDVPDMRFKQLYVGENAKDMPIGIAFKTATEILLDEAARYGKKGPIGMIRWKLEMTATDASHFLDRLTLVQQAAVEEDERTRQQYACTSGNPYVVLEHLYDITESIYDRHYEVTRDSLDEKTGILLDAWMEEQKQGMGYGRVDFEQSYADNGLGDQGAIETLSKICGR
jgi:hypothetical protein